MYRGYDAEMFVALVDGKLTEEQKQAWRNTYDCDVSDDDDDDDDDDDANNMFFRELDGPIPNGQIGKLLNVDGD